MKNIKIENIEPSKQEMEMVKGGPKVAYMKFKDQTQGVGDAAARSTCQNNLKQMG